MTPEQKPKSSIRQMSIHRRLQIRFPCILLAQKMLSWSKSSEQRTSPLVLIPKKLRAQKPKHRLMMQK